MSNYQVSFCNGPTIVVRATCDEGARIAAVAQTRRSFDEITSVFLETPRQRYFETGE